MESLKARLTVNADESSHWDFAIPDLDNVPEFRVVFRGFHRSSGPGLQRYLYAVAWMQDLRFVSIAVRRAYFI